MKLPMLFREFEIREIDKEKRTVDLSFSSETPVERYFGFEILDHKPGSVRLGRLQGKAPLLLDHDRTQQIGVVERAEIGADNKGRAVVRFSQSAKAQEIWQDVLDGIRTLVSVGYRIHEVILEKKSDAGDTYRVTDWEPLEISIVSIPADVTVGIGRDANKKYDAKVIDLTTNERSESMSDEKRTMQAPGADVTVTAPEKPEINESELERNFREKEAARVAEIFAIGEQFNMQSEAQEAVRKGWEVDHFRKSVLQKLKSEKSIDTTSSEIGMTKKEIERYSLLRVIQAQITGDWSKAGLELEASRALAKKLGVEPKGTMVPHDVLLNIDKFRQIQQRTVSVGGSGGNLVGTEHLASNFIELLRNKAVITRLGALTLTGLRGNVSIPKQTGAATAAWIGEDAEVALSDQTFGNLALSPKTISARTRMTRQMILQSDPQIEGIIMNDLTRQLALGLDLAAINGDGLSNNPVGILNTPGIGSVTGTGLDWAGVVELETDVAASNADDLESMYYLTNAAVRGLLKTRKKDAGSGIFLWEGNEVNGYPGEVSNQVPAATLIFGAFSQVVLAMWGGLDILVNPYAESGKGNVIIDSFQSADVGIRHAAAFSAATSIT
jgi:HK97 family phage major capsid protein